MTISSLIFYETGCSPTLWLLVHTKLKNGFETKKVKIGVDSQNIYPRPPRLIPLC